MESILNTIKAEHKTLIEKITQLSKDLNHVRINSIIPQLVEFCVNDKKPEDDRYADVINNDDLANLIDEITVEFFDPGLTNYEIANKFANFFYTDKKAAIFKMVEDSPHLKQDHKDKIKDLVNKAVDQTNNPLIKNVVSERKVTVKSKAHQQQVISYSNFNMFSQQKKQEMQQRAKSLSEEINPIVDLETFLKASTFFDPSTNNSNIINKDRFKKIDAIIENQRNQINSLQAMIQEDEKILAEMVLNQRSDEDSQVLINTIKLNKALCSQLNEVISDLDKQKNTLKQTKSYLLSTFSPEDTNVTEEKNKLRF